MHRLIIAGIGVLAVALLATGCGGGGGDEATAQVSKAQFYKQAEKVCWKTQKKIQAEFAASNPTSDVYRKVGPLLKREAEELESISGPEQAEERIDPLIANILKASRLLAQNGEVAAKGPEIQAYKQEAVELQLAHC